MTAMREHAELIRVRGLVQGVGFRPTVWRLAHRLGLRGTVANDGQGVSIHVCGDEDAIESFAAALRLEAPPLSRVDSVERQRAAALPADAGFSIAASSAGLVRTGVAPDAASCDACVAEVFDPLARRYRYPFTNCTHCGPRLSIVSAMPYDRAGTSMRPFAMCEACRAEYEDPGDRRFHAQPIACHRCGPRAWLEHADGAAIAQDDLTTLDALDAVDAACALLQRGEIVAIKGLGGFQLACDATQHAVVARLRERKRRQHKPLALMARDIAVVRRHCCVDTDEERLLRDPAAPIVLLDRRPDGDPADGVAAAVAPGLRTLGFMLPNTPLHHLMLRRMARPIVLTSGNLSDEPQLIDNQPARERLGKVAGYFLMHNRDVVRRVDDSVMAWWRERHVYCAARVASRRRRSRCLRVLPPRRRCWRWEASSRTASACCAKAARSCRTTWATWKTRPRMKTTNAPSPTTSACSNSPAAPSPSTCTRNTCRANSGTGWPNRPRLRMHWCRCSTTTPMSPPAWPRTV